MAREGVMEDSLVLQGWLQAHWREPLPLGTRPSISESCSIVLDLWELGMPKKVRMGWQLCRDPAGQGRCGSGSELGLPEHTPLSKSAED